MAFSNVLFRQQPKDIPFTVKKEEIFKSEAGLKNLDLFS